MGNSQTNATATDVDDLTAIKICYGLDCPSDEFAFSNMGDYLFYYPFWYLPNYMLNVAVWVLETV